MNSIYVLQGGFDPFNIEDEKIITNQKDGTILILPNVEEKTVLPLEQRVWLLSTLFPIFNNTSQWIKMRYRYRNRAIVDSSPAKDVLNSLKEFNVIILKRKASIDVPKTISYKYKRLINTTKGLSGKYRTYIENTNFVREFNKMYVQTAYLKSHKSWNRILKESNSKILSVEIKTRGLKCYETLLDCKTLWECLDRNDIDNLVQMFFIELNRLHLYQHKTENYLRHGDLSMRNILVVNDKIAIVDFEKTERVCDPSDLLRDYYQFWSSIDFYQRMNGVCIDSKTINKWKEIAEKTYDFQYLIILKERLKWKEYWNKKRELFTK
jgi:hypothetical protein